MQSSFDFIVYFDRKYNRHKLQVYSFRFKINSDGRTENSSIRVKKLQCKVNIDLDLKKDILRLSIYVCMLIAETNSLSFCFSRRLQLYLLVVVSSLSFRRNLNVLKLHLFPKCAVQLSFKN